MWFPEADRRIYTDRLGNARDPLALRQDLVLTSHGLVWALLGRRLELIRKINKGLSTGDEATAEVDLAQTERQLVQIARSALGLPPPDQRTEDEALGDLDHFIDWLNQKKANTAA